MILFPRAIHLSVFQNLVFTALGYGLRAYQENKRRQSAPDELCFHAVSDPAALPSGLPDQVADQLEVLIQRGGQVLLRRMNDVLYVVSRDAAGSILEQLQFPVDEVYRSNVIEVDPDLVIEADEVPGA